jgi:hypothetical protein
VLRHHLPSLLVQPFQPLLDGAVLAQLGGAAALAVPRHVEVRRQHERIKADAAHAAAKAAAQAAAAEAAAAVASSLSAAPRGPRRPTHRSWMSGASTESLTLGKIKRGRV